VDQCVGRPVAELLRLDPPSALDAAYPAAERHALVTLERPGAGMSPVKARDPGRTFRRTRRHCGGRTGAYPEYAGTASLARMHAASPSGWAADSTEVWYRDETGHLYLPKALRCGVCA